MNINYYKCCELCPRKCRVDRSTDERGVCAMPQTATVARASLHMWEEPPISGQRGSGTVFFSGCPLGCIYCQNKAVACGEYGRELSENQLSQLFMKIEEHGAHNLNLVTATHFIPSVMSALDMAKGRGFSLPVVFNTSGYESELGMTLLDGNVDIYLTDLRYMNEKTAGLYSGASDYVTVAKHALCEMVRQTGDVQIDSDGIMKKGTVVRLLLLPGHLIEAKQALKYLYMTYGNLIYISLMSQYTPMPGMPSPLDRKVSAAEYHSFVSYAKQLGVTQAFTQEGESARESFIPPFSDGGILEEIADD